MARAWWAAAAVVFVAAAIVPSPSTAQSVQARNDWVPQVYVEGPADNPLKGFLPYRGVYDTFPHSMEFEMVAWRDLHLAPDVFDWAPLDGVLKEIAGRGHHAVFRIYADAPNRTSALPAFLSAVSLRTYDDFDNGKNATSVAPDYDDPRALDAMLRLIRALGARYDGDPRIGFITVGLIGFWGEWHTFRPSCACDEWMPSERTQRRVLKAFDEAFDRTKILVRNPDVGWRKHTMGFHDDSFALSTLNPPDWTFVGRLAKARATRQWQREPIGGELTPELQRCAFSEPSCVPDGQDYTASVAATHASWLVSHETFRGSAPGDRERALAGARLLGYDLFVSAVRLRDPTVGRDLKVEVRVQNRGVAPFYYRWPVWVGVADAHGRIVASSRTDWDLRRAIEQGKDATFKMKVKRHGLASGTYTLLLRVEHPLAGGRPLVFANAAWGSDAAGWLSLGAFGVRRD